jgi:hypothetical protein
MCKYNPLNPQSFGVSEKPREADRSDCRRRAGSGNWSRLKSLLQAVSTALLDSVRATSVATISEPAIFPLCQVLRTALPDRITRRVINALPIRFYSAIENRPTCDLTLLEFER